MRSETSIPNEAPNLSIFAPKEVEIMENPVLTSLTLSEDQPWN